MAGFSVYKNPRSFERGSGLVKPKQAAGNGFRRGALSRRISKNMIRYKPKAASKHAAFGYEEDEETKKTV